MGYARPSRTEEIFAELSSGPNGRILVDDLGLIHWHAPRNATDSRPWTNSHLTRPLSRTLRTVDGPCWDEVARLARILGADPKKGIDTEGNLTWAASHTSGNWGFRATKWRYSHNNDTRWRVTLALAKIANDTEREDQKVDRQNLRDCNPSQALTWAARMGILGNLSCGFRNGTRVKTGEVWQEQGVKL
jgi:hypothetical protein